jgi:hypothetical protein
LRKKATRPAFSPAGNGMMGRKRTLTVAGAAAASHRVPEHLGLAVPYAEENNKERNQGRRSFLKKRTKKLL